MGGKPTPISYFIIEARPSGTWMASLNGNKSKILFAIDGGIGAHNQSTGS
jgi:hypothetical protein